MHLLAIDVAPPSCALTKGEFEFFTAQVSFLKCCNAGSVAGGSYAFDGLKAPVIGGYGTIFTAQATGIVAFGDWTLVAGQAKKLTFLRRERLKRAGFNALAAVIAYARLERLV